MLNLLKSNKIITILLVLVAVVLIFYFFLNSTNLNPPHLVSSNPKEGEQKIALDQTVILNFDRAVEAGTLTVTSDPEEKWEIGSIDKDTISLKHRLVFNPFTDYKLTISRNGKELTSLSFTTIPSQSDPRLVQDIQEQLKIDYPLSQAAPYDTSFLHVVYISPLTLEITLKNPDITSREAIEQVKKWVSDNGGDPSGHKYVIASPSPTP